MKILLVLRLYSHLAPMMERSEWKPLGMPAVCKLLEGISRRGMQADVVLVGKQMSDSLRQPRQHEFSNLPGVRFHLVPLFCPMGGRKAQLTNSWKQFGYIFRLMRQQAFDVTYCDRAHMGFGAVLAWMGRKVVVRLHGVANLPDLVKTLVKRKMPSLRLWSFGAPFCLIVGSRDGSAYDACVTERFHPKTPFRLRLNGVDEFTVKPDEVTALRQELALAPGVPVLLMSGRMDADKYPLEFLESIRLLNASGQKCYGVFVGGGALEGELRKRAQDAGIETMVRVCGQIEHSRMQAYLGVCDIYVSLSLYANSTNTVLEAMRAGKCILTFSSDPATGRDEQNAEPAYRDALVLIDRNRVQDELSQALAGLLEHPEQIRQKEELVQALAKTELQTWVERIDWELDCMEAILAGATLPESNLKRR